MATARKIDKTETRIIDTHANGDQFYFFEDDRFPGYVVRESDDATHRTGGAGTEWDAENTIRAADDFTITKMGAGGRKEWNMVMFFEHVLWKQIADLEDTWTAGDTNPNRRQQIEGCLRGFGVAEATAITVASDYVPGGTKPLFNALGLDNAPRNLRNWMDNNAVESGETNLATIQSWRADHPRAIKRAIEACLLVREDGWDSFDLQIRKDYDTHVFLGRLLGTGKTDWVSTSWHGEGLTLPEAQRGITKVIYECAETAAAKGAL